MALTTAERVRLKIMDYTRLADSVYYGDGLAARFLLPDRNLSSASAYVSAVGRWSATAATFDPTGAVAFVSALSANSAFRVTYSYNAFSEAEIQQFLDDGGSIAGAARQAVQSLMFDSLRRARWAAPDGTSYDDTAAITLLKDIDATLETELARSATEGGSIHSWSELQGEWWTP